MTQATAHPPAPAATPASAPDAALWAGLWAGLSADVLTRALDARDPRFDGVFFVGITTTRIYCRPVCPARVSDPSRRRFFPSAATAERAGYRPCLRCRPELAPGRAGAPGASADGALAEGAPVDAVARLARVAERRIAAGALNGRPVAALARDLGVSERHLRRACERGLGVSPAELAQTHRLLLAKRLLADTRLSVTDIAYASGFQSLRRFNATFRDRYRMPPSAARPGRNARERDVCARAARGAGPANAHDADRLPPRVSTRRTAPGCGAPGATPGAPPEPDGLHLTLAFRPPLAWDALVARLARDATPGVEVVEGRRYGRTLRVGTHAGTVFAEAGEAGGGGGPHRGRAGAHLRVEVAASLVPALMAVLARLRVLFDLDAEPAVVDAHLAAGGLAAHVRRCPGRRVPGSVDGFGIALRFLLGAGASSAVARARAGRVAEALGEVIATSHAGLDRLAPTAARVADAGSSVLESLGVPARGARAVVAVAGLVAGGALRLEPGGNPEAARRVLLAVDGVDDPTATAIVGRALAWPDAFPATDALNTLAARWRPWRAYAAEHLGASEERASEESAGVAPARFAPPQGPADRRVMCVGAGRPQAASGTEPRGARVTGARVTGARVT